jgi:hypothetical protein
MKKDETQRRRWTFYEAVKVRKRWPVFITVFIR